MAVQNLTVMAMVVLLCLASMDYITCQTTPSQCKDEREQLVNACRSSIIFKQTPTAQCCQGIRAMHVECVCPYITPKMAALIGVDRAIKYIEGCGRTVPHKFKCGGVTTP